MLANQSKGEQLLKETEELYSKLEKQIQDIEESGKYLHKDARSHFRDLQQKYPEDITTLNEKDLRSLNRELRQIDELKSSTLAGAEQAYEMYGDIEEMIESFGPRIKEKFWEAYDRIYGNKEIAANLYKYDVLREMATEVYKSRSKKKTLEEIEESIVKALEFVSGDISLEEAKEIANRSFEVKKAEFEALQRSIFFWI